MKKSLKTIILLATAIFICSCGQKDQKEKYIEYICDNGEYTVYIPDDFKLTHKVGSFMAFSSEGEIATFIAINKSNSTSLDKEISKTNQNTNGFEFKLIEENSYMKLYQAQRGMLTVYNMFMLAGEDSNKYLIQINSPTMSKKNVIAMGKKILLRFKYMTATYSNPWYSISYPQSWIKEEVYNQLMDVAIGKENGDITFSVCHILTDYSLSEINNMGIEDLTSAGARILSNNKTVINGTPCYVTEIYHQQKQVSYTFKENGVMYNIRFTSPNNWIDYNKGEIDKIIQSFKIK